jgi:hypothetical protein
MASGVTPEQIWDALEAAGASSIQAAAIMGNMISESSLNPEAVQQGVSDPGYGLVQWEASSYPSAPSLVTGDPVADMQAQITFLAQTGGLSAASGSTVAQAASNFAANYERCEYCAPGESQNTARQAQAATVAGWASSGNWPSSAGSASDTATLTSAQVAQTTAAIQTALSSCAVGVPWLTGAPASFFAGVLSALSLGSAGSGTSGEICLLTKSQARSLIGAGLLVLGVFGGTVGVGVIAAAAALSAAEKIAGNIIGVRSTVGAVGRAVGTAAAAS